MGDLIEGRIAQILSENHVVLNVGARDGVKVGMIFVVLALGDEVKDPVSGEVLGRWEMPKGHLCVTHVQERLATCAGYDPTRRDRGEDEASLVLSAALVAHSMRPETWREKSATALNVDRSQVTGLPAIGPISVGDIVREVPLESLTRGKGGRTEG